MSTYTHCITSTSKSYRDSVLCMLPNLDETQRTTMEGKHEARVFREMENHFVFGIYRNRNDQRSLLLPHPILAKWVGVHPHTKSFRSLDWIERFNDRVHPVEVSPYNSTLGKCRAVVPHIPEAILAERDAQIRSDLSSPGWGRVDFVTGRTVTQRAYRAGLKRYEASLRKSAQFPDDHPAKDLLLWLNSQPQNSLEKTIKSNWQHVLSVTNSMPKHTPQQQVRKDAALRVLHVLQDYRRMWYSSSDGSPRLYAVGASIHQLPREIRHAALKGSIQLDLTACQLAIVAKLWRIPTLQDFLAGSSSVWARLALDLELDHNHYKPFLKELVYSAIFGMRKQDLLEKCEYGTTAQSGLGAVKSKAFINHTLIRDLLEARRVAFKDVKQAGRLMDAYGRSLKLESKEPANLRSLVAQQVQSYEMRVMSAALPVLQIEKDIRVISWLHDGITIRIQDPTEERRKLRRVIIAIDQAAEKLGFATRVQTTVL